MAAFVTHGQFRGSASSSTTCSLQQGAGFTSTGSASLPPSRTALRRGPHHAEGPACSHPSHPCQTTPRAGKELKQPQRPLLFGNFSAFHNPPYRAANSCARALAAARGRAQPGHRILCVPHCLAALVCQWFMGTPARGDLVLWL